MHKQWLVPFALGVGLLVGSQATAAPTTIRVPQDARDIPTALKKVGEGGTIELATGIYAVPAKPFKITGRKAFTIRAAVPGGAVLDGQGSRQILRVEGTSDTKRPRVTFEGLVFRNGLAATFGGALYARFADLTFRDCRFEDSRAKQQGGAILVFDAVLRVERCTFLRNRTDFALNTGVGGALAARRSRVTIVRSRFSANRAAWAGGAVYAYGDWKAPFDTPSTLVDISGSDFADNVAQSAVAPPPGPSTGGAIHGEDQASIRISTSRFTGNRGQNGGALSLYRADGEVSDSVFRDNSLLVPTALGGGTVYVVSVDFPDAPRAAARSTGRRPPSSPATPSSRAW